MSHNRYSKFKRSREMSNQSNLHHSAAIPSAFVTSFHGKLLAGSLSLDPFVQSHVHARQSPKSKISMHTATSAQRIRRATVTAMAAAAALLSPMAGVQACQRHQPRQAAHAASLQRSSTSSCRGKTLYVASAGGGAPSSFKVAASAALVASTVATLVCHPIDTLKTLKQAESMSLTPVAPGEGSCEGDANGPQSRSDTSSNEYPGLSRLYKGVLSNVLKEAPNAAVYLGCYELFKGWLLALGGPFTSFPLLSFCVAGMLGDAVGSVIRVPAEVLNKRLQLGLNANWNDAIQDAFLSSSGVQTTIASWKAVLWRDVPYGGVQIALYEVARSFIRSSCQMGGILLDIVAGAFAGLVAAFLTTPADVLVTRMAAQNPQCYLETRKFMSPAATFKRICEEEGFSGLWTGALQRGLYYAPLIGVFFAFYEVSKHFILNPNVLLKSLSSSTLGSVGLVMGASVFLIRNQSRLLRRGRNLFHALLQIPSKLRQNAVRNS